MRSKNLTWNTRRPLILGYLALFTLVAGLGIWSVKTNIAGAIVSTGVVEVEENRQVVQHPEGGVIGEILVDDGDMVQAGDVLLRFDDTLLRSDLAVVRGQIFEIMARKSRLQAERDGLEKVEFSAELLANSHDPLVPELMQGQIDLFNARQDSLTREAALLGERKAQIDEQIKGSQAQMDALVSQMQLIAEELVDEAALLAKGLSQAKTVRALQREQDSIQGSIGALQADIAQSRGRIAETEIEIIRLQSSQREEAITTLRDLQYNEIELRESKTSLLETLERMVVTAPASGVIYGRRFNSVRSVVLPADPILYIVPQDSRLVISTRIPAIHIDQVHIGQIASLRFSAFENFTTPEILGQVTKISPDVFTDENTGSTFYTAEIVPSDEEMAKLDGLDILPGMPVATFLKTGDRSPLEYLLKPLLQYFDKAFREN